MRRVWSLQVILPAATIAVLYVIATVYLMNAGLVKDALFGVHSFDYRVGILIALLGGMWTAMSTFSLILLVTVATLTGLNLVLTLEQLRTIQSSGKMHLAIGGSSVLGIVGSGCASCGLPILALLGFGGAAAYLPFRGVELSFVAIILLSVSLYVLIKGRTQQAYCVVNPLKYQEQYAPVSE